MYLEAADQWDDNYLSGEEILVALKRKANQRRVTWEEDGLSIEASMSQLLQRSLALDFWAFLISLGDVQYKQRPGL